MQKGFFSNFGIEHGRRLIHALLLVFAYVGVGIAAPVEPLYEAETPVEGQSSSQRNAAIDAAFAKVLVKVTGNRAVVKRPELRRDLTQGDRYVQQYRYRLESVSDRPGSLLSVRFDQRAVNRLLHDRGLPVWGSNRPTLLLWLGVERNGRRQFYLPDTDASLRDALRQVERARGVTLLFPLLDLEDQSKLKISDLWGGFETRIHDASERYAPGAILTGRLRENKGRWRGEWTLYGQESPVNWSTRGVDAEAAAREGLQQAIDLIASRYAPLGGDAAISRVNLRIEAVSDLTAYGRLIRHLSGLDGVEQLLLTTVEPSAIGFRLRVRGGQQVLEQGIRLGGLLERLPEALSMGEVEAGGSAEEGPPPPILEYRLNP